MGLWEQWNRWRNACKFLSVGAGCELPVSSIEVKGRVELGGHCIVRPNVVLRTHKKGHIVIESGVELGDYAMIASDAEVRIGANTYVGPHCVLRDINHVFQGTDVHWRLTPHITGPIHVGKNCFLGARSYIMPGVTIGDGAVITPGSVVTRDVGECEVWAGTPSARCIAHRTDPERGPDKKRHAELLTLFGFELDGEEASEGEAAEAAVETPKPRKKKAAAKKKATAKKKGAVKKKPAAKKATAKKKAAPKKKAAAKKKAPAKKKPAAKKRGSAKKNETDGATPAAVKKALSDASDVLKSL